MPIPEPSNINTTRKGIPCQIIAGPLGVGKTSTILNYLRKHADKQRVGVLVNDFGPIGLDSTTINAEAPQAKVFNVPGGCICCTMLAELPTSIRRVLSQGTIDRLIIEPSGMASPTQVIDVLQLTQAELGISLMPTVVILSAADFDAETFERMAYYRVFCEAADVLVFNRCDQASDKKVSAAKQWASKLDPPKQMVLATSYGQLSDGVFDLSLDSKPASIPLARVHQHHDHEHDHDPTIHAGGFVLDAGRCFDDEVLLLNLIRICHLGIDDSKVLRLKGVFHTTSGWQSVEIANREVALRPSAHRRDNRMEWLTKPRMIGQDRVIAEITRPIDRQEIAGLLKDR